eukprot:CAMPEP_0118648788 /NCGR_PEP_ID=MMETSP0785-20121206/9351_1 /TAXON_ID=91992 /ORGANISM="Bolidomonas pacifica, Strain CCMP 1866" /LENGTH=165 /DNA_ID=CAMNT_0006541021 /DNA_START=110 /DNA_END=604 /DNA_ORIENTATION=-
MKWGIFLLGVVLRQLHAYAPTLKLYLSYDLSTPSHIPNYNRRRSRRFRKRTVVDGESNANAWDVVEDMVVDRMTSLTGLQPSGRKKEEDELKGEEEDANAVCVHASSRQPYLPSLVPPPGIRCDVEWRIEGGGTCDGEHVLPTTFPVLRDLDQLIYKLNKMMPDY